MLLPFNALTTLSAGVTDAIVAIVFIILWRQHRRTHLLAFGISFTGIAFILILLGIEQSGQPLPWREAVSDSCFIATAVLLLAGCIELAGRRIPWNLLVGAAAAVFLIARVVAAVFGIPGVVYIPELGAIVYVGIAFMFLTRPAMPGNRVLGYLFVARSAINLPWMWAFPHGLSSYVHSADQVAIVTIGWALVVTELTRATQQAKIANAELQQSEQRFRDYAETASDWFWESGPTHQFTHFSEYINPTDIDLAFLFGKRRWDTAADVEAEPEKWREHRRCLDRRAPFRDFVYPVKQNDGTLRYVATSGKPVFDGKGRFSGYRGGARDITDRVIARQDLVRRQEIALRHKNALIESVHVSQILNLPLAEAIRSLTEIAGETLQVDRAIVFRGDGKSMPWEPLDLWNRIEKQHRLDEREPHAVLDIDLDGPLESMMAVEDVLSDPRLAQRLDYFLKRNIRATLGGPVYVSGRFYGTVAFSMVTGPRKWTDEEMQFARSVADLVALVFLSDRYRESLAALDLIEDGIYVGREDGRVIYANRVAREIAGIDDAQQLPLFGAPTTIFPQPPVPLRTDRDQHEVPLDLGSGHRDLQIERNRLPSGGTIVLIHDITQRRAAEREREELQARLQQASKMEAIGRLAGGIAHDFNNLLGTITGFASFLAEDLPKGTSGHGFAAHILTACGHAKTLIAQILAFARVGQVERKPTIIQSVLHDSGELLRGSLPASTKLDLVMSEEALPILGNSSELSQLIVNLCVNANDALNGAPGSIAVHLAKLRPGDEIRRQFNDDLPIESDSRARIVAGRLDEARDYARISVTDTGTGIDPVILPKIFEPFFTTKDRGRGTGLGLAAVHGIVTSYGGAYSVDSTLGHGTNFTIYLPLMASSKAVDTVSVPSDARGREHILLVDDDVDLTNMLSIGLKRLGYDVAVAQNAYEALKMFGADPRGWDVMVSDQSMQGMTGLSLIGEIKALRPDLAVILCTGFSDGTTEPLARKLGADCLLKPFEPHELAARIRVLLDRSEVASADQASARGVG